jgi:hypothetical protein
MDTPAEGAARDDDEEISGTGETESDSFPKTDDELVSGASNEREAEVRKKLENIRNSINMTVIFSVNGTEIIMEENTIHWE